MCVSGYRPSLSLGHQPWFFYCRFWLFTIDSSRRKMFSASSLFLLQHIWKITLLKVFLLRSRAVDNTSAEIKLSANENEGVTAVTPRDKLKNVYFAVLFSQKVLQASKIITKNKIIIWPTYPIFKKHVTGNTHFFGPSRPMQTDTTSANNSQHCWMLLANNVVSVCIGLKVWPVLNYTQQVPTLLWFHANGRNKS